MRARQGHWSTLAGHEMPEFVGGSRAAASWIALNTYDGDRDIVIYHRCTLARNFGDQHILARALA